MCTKNVATLEVYCLPALLILAEHSKLHTTYLFAALGWRYPS